MIHGAYGTPENQAWRGMKQRCSNPNYNGFKNYGGRGINVCERWRDDFAAFLADMGPRPSPKHTLERIDNDGDYTPENCRWATRVEQSRNRRSCIYVEDNGQQVTAAEYARKRGINPGSLRSRIRRFQSLERALSQPFRRRRTLKSQDSRTNTAGQSHKKSA